MTIHLGQSFALAIIALVLVLMIATLANKTYQRHSKVSLTVKYVLLLMLFAMCWVGAWSVCVWIAGRF